MGTISISLSSPPIKCTFLLKKIDDRIENAVRYILQNFKDNGNKFLDRSVVGTGHRGVLNLQYPVYAFSFPLVALSRFLSYVKGEKRLFLS